MSRLEGMAAALALGSIALPREEMPRASREPNDLADASRLAIDAQRIAAAQAKRERKAAKRLAVSEQEKP